ncbi:MAG: glycosyltransferase family 2 protein [Candidatus Electrothrix sp. AW3_4]|nr:glycosyltransferase family 2 protein [Candidatus Electrothrix gigas]
MIRLAIIIINYKTPTLVQDCIQSLSGQIQDGLDQVVVVDNNSGDGSVEQLEKFIIENGWTDWIKVIPSLVNGGFSAGNNIGIRAVKAEYYMLLNSDTIVRPGAVDKLLSVALMQSDVGIVGPRMEWPDGTPQGSCFRTRSPAYEFFAAAQTGILEKMFGYKPRTISPDKHMIEPEWISFACVLINSKVFEQVGLLDEGYFMYYEDIDFSRRTLQFGYKIVYSPSAIVVHLQEQSSVLVEKRNKRRRLPNYMYQSRAYYYRKFYRRIGLILANTLWMLGFMVSLLRKVLHRRELPVPEYAWKDIWMETFSSMKVP